MCLMLMGPLSFFLYQTYKDKGALKRHIHTTHTEDIELHTCDECGKQYKHRKVWSLTQICFFYSLGPSKLL